MRRALISSLQIPVLFRNHEIAAAIALACLCFPASAQSRPTDAQAPAAQAGSSVVVQGQASPSEAKPADLSREAIVYDKLYTRVREEADGTGTHQTTARVRIQSDAGVKDMAVLTLTYTASNQKIEIAYVRVIKPDGSVVVTPDYNIQDMAADVTREAPMYSDIHQKHIAVRGLGVGDILEYQATLTTLKSDVPGQFWFEYSFEKDLILLDEQLDIDLPADKPVTVASADQQPTVTNSGGRKLYHWASSNSARPDPDAPPKSTKGVKPSVQVTTFTSWEQIGAWYASLQKDQLALTPAIQARAAALTKGLTSDEDKLRAIFNDVALHIHYVGLDFGIGRYQPHPADDVLSNEYGDCKDKHTLLAALLKAAGIEAWPVLISSSRELDPATPSPAQFDHVITLVPLSGKLVWMDSTAEIAPIGVIFANLRDKQALAIPANKSAYLERTPAELPFPQSTLFDVKGKLSDQGTFTAHFDQTVHGDAELILRIVLRAIPQSQWKQFAQSYANNIGFAGEVKEPEISSIEQTGQPLHISYDYTREKYGEWDSHRISPPMPPFGVELAPGVKQIKPADDVDLGSPGEVDYSTTVQIPEGWSLMPAQATDRVEDWAEYHAKYAFADGVFTAERRLVVKKDKVPLADWDKYLDFRRAVYDDEVRMEPIFNPDSASGSFIENSNPFRKEIVDAIQPLHDAVTVFDDESAAGSDSYTKATAQSSVALDAIEAKSLTFSADDMNSFYWAQALDYAWCVRGWSALLSKDLPTAEAYLRPAWRLHPDRITGYLLGRLLEAKNDKVAAAHQYELAHVSNNPGVFGLALSVTFDSNKQIAEGYRRVTGKDLIATALNAHGAYSGSLWEERDRLSEIHGFIRTTTLTGTGFYKLVFENGKAVSASFVGGDKGFEALVKTLQAHSYPSQLPSGSKARLSREIKLICTPYAGCDAYLLLPNAIEMPSKSVTVINVSTPNASKETRTIHIVQAP